MVLLNNDPSVRHMLGKGLYSQQPLAGILASLRIGRCQVRLMLVVTVSALIIRLDTVLSALLRIYIMRLLVVVTALTPGLNNKIQHNVSPFGLLQV